MIGTRDLLGKRIRGPERFSFCVVPRPFPVAEQAGDDHVVWCFRSLAYVDVGVAGPFAGFAVSPGDGVPAVAAGVPVSFSDR